MKMMPMISCQKASHLISERMDRRLTLKELISLKLHLVMCEACTQVSLQFKGLRILLRAYRKYLFSKSTTPSSLNQTVKERIKKVLASQ
jgi:hypothetical protein